MHANKFHALIVFPLGKGGKKEEIDPSRPVYYSLRKVEE